MILILDENKWLMVYQWITNRYAISSWITNSYPQIYWFITASATTHLCGSHPFQNAGRPAASWFRSGIYGPRFLWAIGWTWVTWVYLKMGCSPKTHRCHAMSIYSLWGQWSGIGVVRVPLIWQFPTVLSHNIRDVCAADFMYFVHCF